MQRNVRTYIYMYIRCTVYKISRAMLYTMDDRNKGKKIYYTCAAAGIYGWWACAFYGFGAIGKSDGRRACRAGESHVADTMRTYVGTHVRGSM